MWQTARPSSAVVFGRLLLLQAVRSPLGIESQQMPSKAGSFQSRILASLLFFSKTVGASPSYHQTLMYFVTLH